jgi:hypothetical protein
MKARWLLALLLLSSTARAAPWMPGRWHFWLQLRESVLVADQRWDATGHLQPILAVVDPSGTKATSGYRWALTDLYGELGFGTRLSLVVDFAALSAIVQPVTGEDARSAVGVSDLYLAGKLLLFDDELTATLLAGVTVPTGALTTAVPLGPGDVRGDLILEVGKIFERPAIFLSADVGFRLRGMDYSHQLVYAAQAGWTWRAARRGLRALTLVVKLEGRYALATPVEDGLGLLTPQSERFTKLGGEVVAALGRGVALTVGGHYFVAGQTMPAFGEAALAISYAR